MANLKKIQKKVMDELFEGEKNEREILSDNNISYSVYSRWLKEDGWKEAFQRRIDEAERRAQILVAGNKPAAAEKLIKLMDCEKEQTARQACLDIINMPKMEIETKEEKQSGEKAISISDKMAETLIEALVKVEKKEE